MWALYRRRCFPPRRVWFSSTTATTTTTSHKLKLPLLDEKKRGGGGTGGYEANHSSGFLNLKLIPEEMPRIVDIRYRDLKENFFVMTRPSDISVMEYLRQAQEESSPSSSSPSVANRIGMVSIICIKNNAHVVDDNKIVVRWKTGSRKEYDIVKSGALVSTTRLVGIVYASSI